MLSRMLCAFIAIGSMTVLAADEVKPSEPNATSTSKTTQNEETDPVKQCKKTCDMADAKCGSDVRRARAECSRNAANAGRDPFSQYRPYDYSYFCGYFNNPGRCNDPYYRAGCQARYQQHYYHCLDAMRYNIASMRYDCYESERDASNVCRDELRQCKAACGG